MNWPTHLLNLPIKHRVNKANMEQPQEEFVDDMHVPSELPSGSERKEDIPAAHIDTEGIRRKEAWVI
jgi:hypothetical protein